MKNKSLISILLFILSVFPAEAQLLEYNIQDYKNTIVREYSATEVLAYFEDAADTGCFMFYSLDSSTALFFKCKPGWSVKDVRIMGGMAYFCGTDGGGKALIGCFDVAAVFAGTGVVNHVDLDWLPYPDGLVLATCLNRLDLFQPGAFTVMAMVGDAWYHNYSYQTSAIVSARLIMGTTWEIWQFINKDAYVKYTDIAYLDDLVVAVGTDSTDNGCLMKSFWPSFNFPNHPCTYRTAAKLSTLDLTGKVLASRSKTDMMNAAQHIFPPKPETMLHEVEFDPVTGLPAGTISTQRTSTLSPLGYAAYGWTLYELVSLEDGIFVLEQADHPTAVAGMNRWLLDFPAGYSGTLLDAWHLAGGDLHTMDNSPRGLVQASGVSPSNLYETFPDVCTHGTDKCAPAYTMPMVTGTASWSPVPVDEGAVSTNLSNNTFIPVILGGKSNILCD